MTSGSNVNAQDSQGLTPLMVCCAEDTDYDLEARCVAYLLSHKADPDLADKNVRLDFFLQKKLWQTRLSTSLQGYTALHYASAAGNSEGLIHLFDYLSGEALTKQLSSSLPGKPQQSCDAVIRE